MSTGYRHANEFIQRQLQSKDKDALRSKLGSDFSPPSPRIAGSNRVDAKSIDRRWSALSCGTETRETLLDETAIETASAYAGNIENFIGTVRLPVGIAGPLRVNGLFAKGDYYVPLATTEAALVASYNRGAQLVTAAGGCTSVLVNEGVSRAPGFAFRTLVEAGEFMIWALSQMEALARAAESTTRHGKLVDLRATIEGNHVYLNFEMTTGDAAGQNMVTLAAQAICDYIAEHSPVPIEYSFVEANLSGDKKASFQSFNSVRGRKVVAEISISETLLHKWLHTTPQQIENYWRMSAMGGVISGAIGVHGHYANGLAALFIATGQDAACVAEAAVGVTRMERRPNGDLYASVTMPNLIVGTVGGGTGLPSQHACLDIMGLAGSGKTGAFAEVCAALVLAGELSIIGALCAGHFTRAHEKLARSAKEKDLSHAE